MVVDAMEGVRWAGASGRDLSTLAPSEKPTSAKCMSKKGKLTAGVDYSYPLVRLGGSIGG